MTDTILYERAGHIGRLVLNNPEKHNSLGQAELEAIQAVLGEVAGDSQVRVLVVTGAGGKTFCAGASLQELNAGKISGDTFQNTTDQLAAPVGTELPRRTGHRVDVITGDRTVTQRVGEVGGLRQRPGSFGGLRSLVQRLLRRVCNALLRERIDVLQSGDETGVLSIAPCLHLAHRDQTGLDQINTRGGTGTHVGDGPDPLDHRCDLHTRNGREGVSHS